MFFVSLRYPSRGGKDIPTAKASRAVDTVRICRSQVFLLHVSKQRTSATDITARRGADECSLLWRDSVMLAYEAY